jgi:hypothetical protein
MGPFSASDTNDEFINILKELFDNRAMAFVKRLEPPEVESSHTA